ncbi:double-stranded RNA-specific adenosine deaminase [Seriola lalandi dorsalis]|uniref:Adenosine deaminase RNA specific n=1 Tax=Seriola lalandi dorsalis TaxID=1841481 RepID=A0A3B4Y3S4_SERLL|nr:double-stranded RNA-specific adenosine deaminase [Seriola lalandi dorsalis]XP_023264685.1 double-stranded RNA-specific adenosine deaminase [Seriola lalandi dorsalis]XP_023264686.1 double-stranded RNA-specific adenosine deaminase [Seriola lalandi dorsalis]XP_023264687.1 double-stranded RNA-specific adenosine deaminase [Seriola lalandi dorsalis]
MSRGRGGPSREHYHKHSPLHLQAKENYNRPGPASFYPRAGPQQTPYSSYYDSPAPPVVSIQPPAPSLIPSAPPVPSHIKPAPKPVALNNSHNQNYSPSPAPNSFQYQQVEFLRGHGSEAPQFRASPRGGGGGVVPGRPPISSYQPQSGYSRYPNSNNSPRGRGGYRHDHSFECPPTVGPLRGPQGPRHLNQNQLQSKNHNQYSNRQWSGHTDFSCDNFQRLSLHQDRPSRGERFGRHSASSSSSISSFSNVNITLTPDIQDQVHRALAALKPSESISAKLLAKKLRLPKKIVNKALYSLERSQKASKEGLHPPEWTVYRKPLGCEEAQNSKIQSPLSNLCVSSGHPPKPEAKVELKTETARNRGQAKEEDSDTESSSSYSSSLESSDSEASQSPAQGQHEEKQHPGTTSAPDQELLLSIMAEQKELVLRYLLDSEKATALVIAKNLGLRSAKQVNPTLYVLEKQGDVIKDGEVNPPTWELSTHRRERMERSLKAAQSTPVEGVPMEEETRREEKGGGSIFLPSPPLPPIPGLEPLPLPEGWMPEQSHSEASNSSLQPRSFTSRQDKETNEGQWADDEIPEFLNAIRRETDAEKLAAEKANNMGTVAVSLAAPPPQNLWAKLQEVRLKNPVSGLMEYAQYLGQNCEFQLLDQSGPSHDPRFRMQVMLNGKLFPVAEASSKKVAKKDAAAAALRILIGEMQGGASTGDEENTANTDQVMDLLPDTSGAAESIGGIFGSGSVEGMGMVEGPRQPLSRSLPGGKNPVSVLMEYSQRSGNPIEFIITGQAGPPHDPRFMYRVKVGESLFAEASAPSKKAARQLAAEEAVKELMSDGRLQLNKPQLPLGSSSDSDGGGSGTTCPSLPPLTADELRAAHEAGVGDLINHLNNNAVSGLLEYARARGFAAEIRLVGQSGPPHEPKFTYQAKLGGRWFPPVCASNKKQGKQEAADAALRVLIGEAERAARTGELIPAELPVSGSTLHDQIAMLSHQRFNALTTRIQHSLLGRKILATIVMRRGEGLGTVVSLGTGNRCVKGEELSLKGETVNDCHAEIISRRGFVRFLYTELLKHYDGADDSIFEPAENNKLRIKSDITFHLYISTAPCGDGALFDKSCSEAGDEVEGHQPLFENAKQGKLRTKVENGEGTIPVESSAIVPTWDGIQHGERLRTMSCSDKILRWNVLGLQGALLTHFLHPIYLKSITLGYLYSHGHLTRAVCCRLARDGEAFDQSLPAPFKLNHPEVGRVSVYDSTRHTGKTKESSVNWSFPDQHSVEVLDGTKGKLDGNKLAVSRVSKSNLFCLFRSLCQRCGRTDLLSHPSYAQAKMSAMSFQLAKQQFFRALSVHGYGAWIGKPLEEKSFESGEGIGKNGASVPVGYGSSRNGGAMEYKQEEA